MASEWQIFIFRKRFRSWRHPLLVTGQTPTLSQKLSPRACCWRKLAIYQWQLWDLRLVSCTHVPGSKFHLFSHFFLIRLVLSSVNEPLSGWVDNWNGPTGIVSAVGKGIFHTIMCNEESVADFIPVDLVSAVATNWFEARTCFFNFILNFQLHFKVINLMVAAAWKTAITKPAGMTIYNCCTGEVKPITWGRLVSLAIENMRIHPLGEAFRSYLHLQRPLTNLWLSFSPFLEGAFWYPTGILRRNRAMNAIHSILAHYVPAYILDILARAVGKKPM